ncbi:six-hairpin glycosidase [Corynespora cassiicola Philippines]|uniref:Six-hairpin glycosidase n=1 Tax=Corynespora cassiicola Philippines TaxID=1448308 RepID=A0A2T2NCU2_CORCC|nr:six-hairpin glycosidase [Corynespora cassiicola Philippines]
MKLLFASLLSTVFAGVISNDAFHVTIDDDTGAIVELLDPKADIPRNWVSSPANAPWKPPGIQWGLGYFDGGPDSLHRHFWSDPNISCEGERTCTSSYTTGLLEVSIQRVTGSEGKTLTETFAFKNIGNDKLNLSEDGRLSLAIFTPFNDHYTNTSDALENRSHAHIWANGGSTAWVKMSQMGGNDRDLGLVLVKGALDGYSVESRDGTTLSNTRGVFLLHPLIPPIDPGEVRELEWTLFWHEGWDDFFGQCAIYSEQFISFNASTYTITPGENATIDLTGALVNQDTTINNSPVSCDDTNCSFVYSTGKIGRQTLSVTNSKDGEAFNSTIFLNSVPAIDDLISRRVKFITQKQQVNLPNTSLHGAFVLYDNQMEGQVTFDTRSDRNPGRERVGMGNLIARWLKRNSDAGVEASFIEYYNFVCTQLQDESGYVLNGPGNRGKRLYNWPWVMQLHVVTSALNITLPSALVEKKPLERFMLTLENFYSEGGGELYAIGLPIYEGLRALNASGDNQSYELALSLFEKHGQFIIDRGLDYPPFEVNFEQSIVAPAAIMMLELYRWTGHQKWLEAGELQLETLLRFAGKQPDYRLHDVPIRHWDGYWFGKDRLWGDTFPHHWSTLNAIALHHYGEAVGDGSYATQAEGLMRGNLALFDEHGRGYCAWIYPMSINGRPAHYADPYANDQDWVLNHLLQIRDEKIF